MTLPKGYVIPNKEAEEKTKREAEEKTKREAEEKTKREAEEKTKREAEEKTILQEPHKDSSVTNNLNSNRLNGNQGNIVKTWENNFNYYMIWEQLREAYLHTLKEATSSYFRLLDFWSQPKNYKD
jgi:hypothetical protein